MESYHEPLEIVKNRGPGIAPMIIKIGVKTTEPELVAYRVVKPDESEAVALAQLSAFVHEKGGKHLDPSMIVYLDPKDKPGCAKEVMIRLDKELSGVQSKIFPSMRMGFIVYTDAEKPSTHYYSELLKYLDTRGFKVKTKAICSSLEGIFEPEQFGYGNMSLVDEDKPEVYETEIDIPIEG